MSRDLPLGGRLKQESSGVRTWGDKRSAGLQRGAAKGYLSEKGGRLPTISGLDSRCKLNGTYFHNFAPLHLLMTSA